MDIYRRSTKLLPDEDMPLLNIYSFVDANDVVARLQALGMEKTSSCECAAHQQCETLQRRSACQLCCAQGADDFRARMSIIGKIVRQRQHNPITPPYLPSSTYVRY